MYYPVGVNMIYLIQLVSFKQICLDYETLWHQMCHILGFTSCFKEEIS